MRHINPNLTQQVLKGIDVGERLVGDDGHTVFVSMTAEVERLSVALRNMPTGRIMPAKQLAYAEGVVAAYMARS